MVHPKNREPLSDYAAPFFAEDVPSEKSSFSTGESPTSFGVIKWSGPAARPRDVGGYLVTWRGEVPGGTPGLRRAFVRVRAVQEDNVFSSITWMVYTPRLRLQGIAQTRKEAFAAVVSAVRASALLQQELTELRRRYCAPAPALSKEEERVFKAIDLLVGARPRYTPIRGTRAWSLRVEDLPKERTADWERHGHTVCSMLRDLIK